VKNEYNKRLTPLSKDLASSEKYFGKVKGSVNILSFISSISSEKNGGNPDNISYNKVPIAHQSTALSYPLPKNISGAYNVNTTNSTNIT
jgi:hypothetical protein